MSFIAEDRVKESSTTIGLGNIVLSGADVGYRSFSSVLVTNDTTPYVVEAVDNFSAPNGQWETGLGTFQADGSLARTTVYRSSAAGAKIDFAAGPKKVFLSPLAGIVLTIFGNLAGLSDVVAARTNLGLGTFATQNFVAPPAIGGTTPNTGAFTTLSAASGSIIASAPAFNATQTWNNAAVTFTGIFFNVVADTSAAGSKLIDLQLVAASRFSVDKAGNLFTSNSVNLSTSSNAQGFSIHGSGVLHFAGSAYVLKLLSTDLRMRSDLLFGWTDGTPYSGTLDAIFARDAPNSIAQRNGVNAQAFRVYNTYTDASNYERLGVTWNTNVMEILTSALGTGAQRDLRIGPSGNGSLRIYANGLDRWQFTANGLIAQADNTYDIGAAGASRPRNIFAAGGVCLKGKAGALVDGDFTNPTDGMIALDTTNFKLYARFGGVWKSVVLV